MQRQILIELQSENDYDSAFNTIQEFESDSEKPVRIGFSANVGLFGGFITDDAATWQAWLKPRNAELLINTGALDNPQLQACYHQK